MSDSKIEQKVPVAHPNGETSQLSTGAVVIRGDYWLHEHLQPKRYARCGPRGEEGCRARTAQAGLREEQLDAGVPGRYGIIEEIGLMDSLEQISASMSRQTAAQRASGTPVRCRMKWARRLPIMT